MSIITNRYEFVYLFDVVNGNPNGDPDAGNLPRLDPETNKGLVTDVCIKRKVRNYVEITREMQKGYEIYVQEKAVLNQQHEKAYIALGIKPVSKALPKKEQESKDITEWMCKNFFDIRAFGAVMTTEVNAGQVRGPIQLAFATSIDSIIPMEVAITRMAVTNEKDIDKERTIGRKHIVPYALYRMHGFISAKLAEKTGFSEDDLSLFWDALENMFEHDHSAARGEMSAKKLIVFKHSNALGNAPAHELFKQVQVERVDPESENPPRSFDDYVVKISKEAIPQGIEVLEMF